MVMVEFLLDFSTKCHEFAESPIWSHSPLAQEDEAHPTALSVWRARGIIVGSFLERTGSPLWPRPVGDRGNTFVSARYQLL